MSYDDDPRPNADRGAYTPPTDDDLPFQRTGYDARRPAPGRPVPMTLIISAAVLLVLIVAVVLFYRSGVRASGDAPPAVGVEVGDLQAPAPVEAQPVDPEAGVGVYADAETAIPAQPEFVPPAETPAPRPVTPPPAAQPAPAPAATAPAPRPAPATPTPAPATPAPDTPAPATPAPAAPAASGTSAVQIGAFSSTTVADREYAAVAAAFPQFARGRTKRVEQVTASNGSTVYRTTVNGFSREEAQQFCAALRAAGRDCLVR